MVATRSKPPKKSSTGKTGAQCYTVRPVNVYIYEDEDEDEDEEERKAE